MSDALTALDPGRSVVIEACAGSGKTWTLVSRIIRLLLAGTQPGDILAITYTRKAAREIEERLQGWLGMLAVADDDAVRHFLCERGLHADDEMLMQARALFERLLSARPGLTINTFHGWFSSLLSAAPLSAGLGGLQLAERTARLRDQAWRVLTRRAGARPEGDLAQSLRWLFAYAGLTGARETADVLIDRRAEWEAWKAACGGGMEGVQAHLRAFFGGDAEDPVLALAADGPVREAVADLARLLGQGTDAQQKKAHALLEASADRDAPRYLALLRSALLTQAGVPVAFKPGRSLEKRGVAERAQSLFSQVVSRLDQCMRACADRHAWAVNVHGLMVAEAMLDAYDQVKRAAGVLDFGDLEWHASQLLADAQTGPFIQARLDARYRHVLLDEFQDTNPLQWQVLMHWLDAYAPDQVQPTLFVVGDPKQSIYRFRRADPRIFAHAREAFGQRFGAADIRRNETRRSSPAVVSLVNALFGQLETFEGFSAHHTTQHDLPGRVEVLPPFGHDAPPEDAAAPSGLRNPLLVPRAAIEDVRRTNEADALCRRLRDMAGRLCVRDPHTGEDRPARYGDMMILLRRRTGLAVYEAALRAHGIPYFGASRGRLLETLEAADLRALLGFLAAPADALALAHVLRSPLFAFTDAHLLLLTEEGVEPWDALRRADADAAPELRRAATLLDGWRLASAHLPVHDLLDRILHEGDLLARYAGRVDELAWPGVRANIEAFMELALRVDSGRYPSLPRFLDELERLRVEQDESPDEGLILGDDPSRGRVRVLTVHAAKGLEAPIVWLADAAAKPRGDTGARVVLSWPPGQSAPEHLSILLRKEDRGSVREGLLAGSEAAAAREDANLLYVAVTRARQCLFVSGVEPARGRLDDTWLERARSAVQSIPNAVQDDAGGCSTSFGELCWTEDAGACQPPPLSRVEPVAPPVGARRARQTMNDAQIWGSGLHAWLEALTNGEPAPPRPAGLDARQWNELEGAARMLIARPPLRRFFDPALYRQAQNEVEFVLTDGRIGRMDRLVEFDEDIWIIDYKSGFSESFADGYVEQMRGYADAVSQLLPGKPVRAALLGPDGELRQIV
ncbi:UvrD-helicase domain-containing protein [Methyloversatilis thermotolerans]|uniref:UvrD-helicase domain-containing protein n=1 Tax=Methyloversatilis thermotolerans TaxID=1346290 RepID=UPI0003A00232|nr:UvrD-helicase domain-containing protein [Methyloversatilis thermotolerans]